MQQCNRRGAVKKLAAGLGLAGMLLLTLLPAPAVAGAHRGATVDAAAVDRYVNDYLRRTDLPGAVVAVTKGDQVVSANGYGHDAEGRPMTARTRVPVASLSKSFTALAVMQLVEAGKVDLDTPVRRYLPEFTMADPRAARITVRELLNQTSGMADSAFPDLTLSQPDTLAGAVARMRDAKLAYEPGTTMRYHNPNFFVAARLVEVVSGTPFARYMAEKVFTPLGMESTTTVDTTQDMPDQAKGYIRAYGQVIPRSQPRWFTNGSHGVVTTAADLARWLVMQNNGGRTAADRQIISSRSIETMRTPPKGGNYAMGWSTYKPENEPVRIQHTGELLTHNSMQVLLPDSGYGIAVVANTAMISGDDSNHLAEGLVELAEGRTPEATTPFTTTADPVLAVLTLLALALGVLGVLRSRKWAVRRAGRPLWRAVLRLLPQAVLVAAFVMLPDLLGFLMNGRKGTLDQVTYAWLALYVWFAAMALAGLAVIATRGFHLLRLRANR
ncbi:serine hydrolase domain-containing protein [Sphaerisporangium fuscum]|uniref:serine hydrolase domain-containing protein n=1 Tax=Sphaerisporangium fuscum TaxID=2835868 RepID=UPI001BDD0295|nr:serine hydrolase domain-containing protein [Sphaerisporangium fuscum]